MLQELVKQGSKFGLSITSAEFNRFVVKRNDIDLYWGTYQEVLAFIAGVKYTSAIHSLKWD